MTVDSNNAWSVKPKMKYHEIKNSLLSRLGKRKAFETQQVNKEDWMTFSRIDYMISNDNPQGEL